MATFKSKMKHLEADWPDKIWEKAAARNNDKGASWLIPLAALAMTGVRPASLEKGIVFEVKNERGIIFLYATYKGAKLLKNPDGTAKRGQDQVSLRWRLSEPRDHTHRPKELAEILKAINTSPGRKITVSYDAEAISTRIREISKEIWPRKTYHVSGVCYRELFASTNKEAGIDAEELAMAMGHISAESQGKYACRPKKASDSVSPKKTFGTVAATTKVKTERAPMARFKAASSLKTAMKKKKI